MSSPPFQSVLCLRCCVASFAVVQVVIFLHSYTCTYIILPWHWCAMNFCYPFFTCYTLCLMLNCWTHCGDMEDQSEMSSVVTAPVKWCILWKSDTINQNKWTIYNVYKFFKDIFEQPEHFGNIMSKKHNE
jgi:hypothetical protein